MFWVVSLLISCTVCATGIPTITGRSPYHIGLGGGIITITGYDFSPDQFDYQQPGKGNVVMLSNDVSTQECVVLKYKTSSTKIECETGPREVDSGDTKYYITVISDGIQAQNSLVQFVNFYYGYTPKITEVSPPSGPPGTRVKIKGSFFTSQIGVDPENALDSSSLVIQGIRFGPRSCDIVEASSSEIICDMQGTYIGDYNATVYISIRGTSVQQPTAMKLSINNKLRAFQAYPVIDSISPREGSLNGGTRITVTGVGFDKTPGKTQVSVDGQLCEIESIDNENLVAIVPASPSGGSTLNTQQQAGGRGLLYERWNNNEVADLDSLPSTSDPGYWSKRMEGSMVELGDNTTYTDRISGLFYAPDSGEFQFRVVADGEAKMYFSLTDNPSDKTLLLDVNNRGWSQIQNLQGEHAYYIEVRHKQGPTVGNTLGFQLLQKQTKYKHTDISGATVDVQRISQRSLRTLETQVFNFSSWDTSTVDFSFFYGGTAGTTVLQYDKDKDLSEEMTTALWDLFTPYCTVDDHGRRPLFQSDFEDNADRLPGQSGGIVTNTQAYCGRGAQIIAGYTNIYDEDLSKPGKGIDLLSNKWLCFAHRGLSLTGTVYFATKYRNDNGDYVDYNYWFSNLFQPSETWKYICIDLHAEMSERINSDIIRVGRIYLQKIGSEPSYLDVLSIGPVERSVNRIRSAAEHTPNMMLQDITVTKQDDAYSIVLDPFDCVADFNLLGILNPSINLTGVDLETPETATIASSDGDVTVTRVVEASHPVSGTWSISLGGRTVSDLRPDLSTKEMLAVIDSLTEVTGHSITYQDICDDRIWTIHFGTGGDFPKLMVDDSILVFDGISLTTKVDPIRDGGLTINDIGGDFFRMLSSGLSVSVTVNNVVAACDDAKSCLFEQNSDNTPTATAVSASTDSVTGLTTLTITGTLFSSASDMNLVTVGGRACEVTSSTSIQIICTLPAGPAGDHDIKVEVNPSGIASQPTALTFTQPLTLSGISPTSGSIYGGTTLTVTGSGFPAAVDDWDDARLLIDGDVCALLSSSPTEVTCLTPAKSAAGSFPVTATLVSPPVSSSTDFEYSSAMTAVVTSLSPTASSVTGGGTLTIEGTGFGDPTTKEVKINGKECTISSWTDTTIECEIPGNPPGSYPVQILVGNQGYADVSGVDDFDYGLSVTSLTPDSGSLMGGTKVIITGSGFGSNCSLLSIKFGDTYNCEITECSNTEITCTTVKIQKQHLVTNNGYHNTYGIGYGWDPQNIELEAGDIVRWKWDSPSSSRVALKVHQTSAETSDEPDESGFNSGEPAPSGDFSYLFSAIGKYFYSGPEIQGDFSMRGTVNVKEPSSKQLQLHVSIGEYEASHDVSAGSSQGAITDGSCSPEHDPIPGCTTPQPSGGDGQYFHFVVWDCKTPRISDIQLNEDVASTPGILVAHSGAHLVFGGDGFSNVACQNRVYLGEDIMCSILSSSGDEITCAVDQPMEPYKAYRLSAAVFNRGNALPSRSVSSSLLFSLIPEVISVSPLIGSISGGFTLEIIGTGFPSQMSDVSVSIFDVPCVVSSSEFSKITCVGGAYPTNDTLPIVLKIKENNVPINSSYGQFTYVVAGVADIDNVSPDMITADDTVNITGNNFGTSPSNVQVILCSPSLRSTDTEPQSRAIKKETLIPVNLKKRKPSPTLTMREHLRRHSDSIMVAGNSKEADRAREEIEQLLREEPIEEQYKIEYSREMVCVDPTEDDVNPCFYQYSMHRWLGNAEPEERQAAGDSCYPCSATEVMDTSVKCTWSSVPSGSYTLKVVTTLGFALQSESVDMLLQVTSITPNQGSIHGGTPVVIAGSNFHGVGSSVSLGSSICEVTSADDSEIQCVTSSHAVGVVTVQVTPGIPDGTSVSYDYSSSVTPVLDSVSPLSAAAGTSVTLAGSNFGASGSTVKFGDKDCVPTSQTDTEISFTVPSVAGGQYPVRIFRPNVGYSNTKQFIIPFAVSSISPEEGSFAGGTLIAVTGEGFGNDVNFNICGELCTVEGTVTSTSASCRAPAKERDGNETEHTCDFTATQPTTTPDTLPGAWTYKQSLTPTVSLVTPRRGGTAGGTRITISGTDFADTGNQVNIAGSICIISSQSSNEIICETEPHSVIMDAEVTVDVPGKGYAYVVPGNGFSYIDRWSSRFTWNGQDPPGDNTFVVIKEGQTILLDQSTSVLQMLLIDGGSLIFDREASDIELKAYYILVVKGGSLSIGSEDSPFENNACITLYGHVQTQELPLFGAKNIAIREGTLDIHGKHIPITWTHLSETAHAGDLTIKLKQAVTWKVNDEIILASTGHRHSMNENEKMKIASVSGDGKELTLTEALQYDHISIAQNFSGKIVETRGEVGLLTRNVKIRGKVNEQFLYHIEACPHSFDSGQFQIQSCFNGKFGEELGSDQYGAVVMLFAKEKSVGLVKGRIEYVEVTEAGQAFRLGRYPIHFHVSGDVTGSYVRGCAIHRTFNRAVTIHAVDHLLVEHNVAYDIMGHAYFTEDGIEKSNIIQFNLAIFVRGSSSLLNVDITPAAFWLVNPTNIVRHNAAAGGTHFGFWYRTERYPSGPSYTTTYCPKYAPLGEFYNNTAHTLGRYGLWIFSTDGYDPRSNNGITGTCGGSRTVAVFKNFVAWRCQRAAESVFGYNIQFADFTALDNDAAGLEFVIAEGNWGNTGSGLTNALVIGHSDVSSPAECTSRGIVIPKQTRFSVDGICFFNFDVSHCVAIGGCSQCKDKQGGNFAQYRRVQYNNSPNRMFFKWVHEHVYIDSDGSLTGRSPETKVVPWTDTLDPDLCSSDVEEFNIGETAAVCDPQVRFHRMAWNGVSPSSFNGKDAILSNEHGNMTAYYKIKRLTHGYGYMAIVQDADTYLMKFDKFNHITNISYSAAFYQMYQDDYVKIQHNLKLEPDVAETSGTRTKVTDLSPIDHDHGDWEWDEGNKTMTYLATDKTGPRSDTFDSRTIGESKSIRLKMLRCYFAGCVTPLLPPFEVGRPEFFEYWSDNSTWPSGVVPQEGDDVVVPGGKWVLVDVALPRLGKVYVDGVLEFLDDRDHLLHADIVMLRGIPSSGSLKQGGRLIAGWPDPDLTTRLDRRFKHKLKILLRGTHNDIDTYLQEGPPLGAKALGVFGFLDLHGIDVGVTWTKLAETAMAGTEVIKLDERVTWNVGDQIIITTTSFEAYETERRKIADLLNDGTEIRLDEPLQYTHISELHTLSDSSTYRMSAEVGLLTRNIQIEGEDYEGMFEKSYGGRVIVGRYKQDQHVLIGNARLSNVEFIHMGQEGYVSLFDPRFALTFLDTGTVQEFSPSYVEKCSFNYNFNTAIGSFGNALVEFTDNVVYHTVGAGIIDAGSLNTWTHNLVTLTVFTGTYNGAEEDQNIEWYGSFSFQLGSKTKVTDNVAAGSERIAYHTDGEDCSSTKELFKNNEGHGTLHGVSLLKGDGQKDCSKISNFYIWRAYDFGIYFFVTSNVEVENVDVVDCTVGIAPHISRPHALTHVFEDKYSKVTKSRIIGRHSQSSCDLKIPEIGKFQPNQRASRFDSRALVGMTWTSFASGPTGAPKIGSFQDSMSYPAIRGTSFLEDTTFAHFNTLCGSKKDVAIKTNIFAEDAQHPIISARVSFINVSDSNRVFIDTPLLSSINPSDCVDFDCDGHKKAIIIDTDGSILDTLQPGTIIPKAEFEWDGDRRRGLGNYRIPTSVITKPGQAGEKIEEEDKYPHKGIYRGNPGDCSWYDPWNAYKCNNIDHRMMVIESLDSDTQDRRLSPVSVLADPGRNGYIDLLNGPQDIGWCFGYTCQERISTFYSIVALGLCYEISFTSTPPQYFRFHLLNVEPDQAVLLKVWLPKPQRYNVFYDGNYVYPTNSDLSTGTLVLTPPEDYENPEEFFPKVTDSVPGSNYYDRFSKLLYILVRGSGVVQVETQPVVVLTFGVFIHENDFFESPDLINNLADLLRIPPENIIVTQVIRETSRSLRQGGGVNYQVEVEIGNGEKPLMTIEPNGEVQEGLPERKYNESTDIKLQAINSFQMGDLQDKLKNMTLTFMKVVSPQKPPNPANPVATNETLTLPNPPPGTKTYAEKQQEQQQKELELLVNQEPVQFLEAVSLVLVTPPGGELKDLAPFPIQPKLYVQDQNGDMMTELGASDDPSPWKIQATLIGGSGTLLGTTEVEDDGNGVFQFQNLAISPPGASYVIKFTVVYPENSTLQVQSGTLMINPPKVFVKLMNKPKNPMAGHYFIPPITLGWFENSKKLVPKNNQPYTWTCSIVETPPGTLSVLGNNNLVGKTTVTLQRFNNQLYFDKVKFRRHGYGFSLRTRCVPSTKLLKPVVIDIGTFTVLPDGTKTNVKILKVEMKTSSLKPYYYRKLLFILNMSNELSVGPTGVQWLSVQKLSWSKWEKKKKPRNHYKFKITWRGTYVALMKETNNLKMMVKQSRAEFSVDKVKFRIVGML